MVLQSKPVLVQHRTRAGVLYIFILYIHTRAGMASLSVRFVLQAQACFPGQDASGAQLSPMGLQSLVF